MLVGLHDAHELAVATFGEVRGDAPEGEAERDDVAGQPPQAFVRYPIAPDEVEHAQGLGVVIVQVAERPIRYVLEVVLQAERAQRGRQRG